MPWEWPVGAVCAFVVALATTPAGVSGAVLLLPVQVSVLGVASPAVTPTNLLFNVAAVPGGLLRFWREARLVSPLLRLLVAGALPGVVAGAVIRVELLAGERAFMVVAAGVLLPLGLWLLLAAQRMQPQRRELTPRTRLALWAASLVVGTVGGIYGVGGGSLLAPLLLAIGFTAYEVAPATLAATFLTSIAGIATYVVLQQTGTGAIGPDWALGAFLGAGGFAGSYFGARLQRHLPDTALRRLLGLIACLVAARYLQTATQDRASDRHADASVLVQPVRGAPARAPA
ncbi:sulfite exporter TauE/SafE family protein [Conexibacter sp. CPCC 206217]|uniref:sulfite exporter TauE/SafE family protein n=1 Tax=Conexibacter sp. CPCC 206217 TaxID=3064574 RepID=UPI00272729E5|nr:sulfite exporter TauE/SafE family protein [Conexibacter sp. CPCC 206217]MDO8208829.1 sulfite exporter TauE/SafE family protein [Conexibacter sp. CPCC 206217]